MEITEKAGQKGDRLDPGSLEIYQSPRVTSNMPRKYSGSLRWRIIFLHFNRHMTPQEIMHTLSLGKTFVHSVLKLYRETKGVELPGIENRGRPRLTEGRDIILIRSFIEKCPELYLDKLRDWIEFQTGKLFTIETLRRQLKQMGLSVAKLQLIAKERDERRRAIFRRFISQFHRHQLLFIDESSKDDRTVQRKYARGLKGTRVSRIGNFTRGTRYSILSAVAEDGIKDSSVIVGAYDRVQFEFAMEHFIIPFVGSFANNERNSVIVMDNCTIHKSQRVFDMIRQQGGIAVFLPPYSPDMNPIELCFCAAKQWLKRHQDIFEKYPKRCFEIAL